MLHSFEPASEHTSGLEPVDIAVVIPVRNAEYFLDECLASVFDEHPAEVIVVDGNSTDRTLEIARAYPVQILNDGGRGLPEARRMGALATSRRLVFLLDCDVVLPPGSLRTLVDEFERRNCAALQAGLESVGGPGYWGRALAHHHRTGRSKHWFGLVATVFDRATLLEHDFDDEFLSGEDVELRLRLRAANVKCEVSDDTVVIHRFLDTRDFALDQFHADGAGLALLIKKRGVRALPWIGVPLVGAVRGIGLSLARGQVRWLAYYVRYAVGNYRAMIATLSARTQRGRATQ